LGLAVLLIEVINRRGFGWSMQLDLPWGQIASATAISTLVTARLKDAQGRRFGAQWALLRFALRPEVEKSQLAAGRILALAWCQDIRIQSSFAAAARINQSGT
jgi:hypothetical protein